jgi:hypothetical protein
MRRFTHFTNAFSKKIENKKHSVALRFMHYNFARIHKNLEGYTCNGGGCFGSCMEH